MRKRWLSAAAALVLSLGASAAVRADLVYENLPYSLPSHDPLGRTVSSGWEVTNSFTASSEYNLTSAEVLLWVYAGDAPTAVDWRIGTTKFGGEVATGSATLTGVAKTATLPGYDIFTSTLAISGLVDTGATYWFTLLEAAAASSPVYWNVSYGSSTAAQRKGPGGAVDLIASQSFRLYGDSATPAVPEPASLTLLGLGAGCGLLVYRRRKGASA